MPRIVEQVEASVAVLVLDDNSIDSTSGGIIDELLESRSHWIITTDANVLVIVGDAATIAITPLLNYLSLLVRCPLLHMVDTHTYAVGCSNAGIFAIAISPRTRMVRCGAK